MLAIQAALQGKPIMPEKLGQILWGQKITPLHYPKDIPSELQCSFRGATSYKFIPIPNLWRLFFLEWVYNLPVR
jgi:hypothetical protein